MIADNDNGRRPPETLQELLAYLDADAAMERRKEAEAKAEGRQVARWGHRRVANFAELYAAAVRCVILAERERDADVR